MRSSNNIARQSHTRLWTAEAFSLPHTHTFTYDATLADALINHNRLVIHASKHPSRCRRMQTRLCAKQRPHPTIAHKQVSEMVQEEPGCNYGSLINRGDYARWQKTAFVSTTRWRRSRWMFKHLSRLAIMSITPLTNKWSKSRLSTNPLNRKQIN